ncbi:hypothetical protein [Collimonas fungivorans]|uniref:hypothetical protein n=1 Tax=Collimonas fungivorans TaxID=158899 RepID=UPI0005A28713|nr:hypothetical protein [Collimonas fungivorans]
MRKKAINAAHIANFQQEQVSQSRGDQTSRRYQALIGLVTGRHAQQFLADMSWDGRAPTQHELEAHLDKMIGATA